MSTVPFRLKTVTHPTPRGVTKPTAARLAADTAAIRQWKQELAAWRMAREEVSRALDAVRLTVIPRYATPPVAQQQMSDTVQKMIGLLRAERTPETLDALTRVVHEDILPMCDTNLRPDVAKTLLGLDIFCVPPICPSAAVFRVLTHRSERVRLRLFREKAEGVSLLPWMKEILGQEAERISMIHVSATGVRSVRAAPPSDAASLQDPVAAIRSLTWWLMRGDETPLWNALIAVWSEALAQWHDEMRREGVEWTPLMDRLQTMLTPRHQHYGMVVSAGWVATKAGWYGQPLTTGPFPVAYPQSAPWLAATELSAAARSEHLRQAPVWRELVWGQNPSVVQPDALVGLVRTMTDVEMRAMLHNPAMTEESRRVVRNWALFDLTQSTSGSPSWQEESSRSIRALNALSEAGAPLNAEEIERLMQYLDFSPSAGISDRLCRVKDVRTHPGAVARVLADTTRGPLAREVVGRIIGASPHLTAHDWMVQARRLAMTEPADAIAFSEELHQALLLCIQRASPLVMQSIARPQWRDLLLHPSALVREAIVRRLGESVYTRQKTRVVTPAAPSRSAS